MHAYFVLQIVVDAVLGVKRDGEPIDLHMVEVMEMMHKTDSETKYIHFLTFLETFGESSAFS